MTLHFFPAPNARDPRTSPRIGDVLRVGDRTRKILEWRVSKGYHKYGWEPTPDVAEVRYSSGRSERWIPMAPWLAWARDAEVVEVSTEPELHLRFDEEKAGVERVEVDGTARRLFFAWGVAVVDGPCVNLVEHDGTPIYGMTWNRRTSRGWTAFEIVVMYHAFITGHGMRPGQPAFRVLEGGQ